MDQLHPSPPNSSPLTPLTFLERAALVYGECPSIIYNNKTYTWSQTLDRCLRLASSLAALGIKRGDVVSVIAPNVPAMYEVHFGVPMSGAVVNTINTRLDARTMEVVLVHSEAKIVMVDRRDVPLLREAMTLIAAKTPFLPKVVVIEEDGGEIGDDIAVGIEVISTYEDLVRKGNPDFKWVRPLSGSSPMVLNYTSGTTSEPKGVVQCHRGLFVVVLDSLINWGMTGRSVFLWTLPMFHCNGWSFSWGLAAIGGTNVCLRRFDAATIYTAIWEHKVTHMCGAPIVLNMIVNGWAGSTGKRSLPHPVHILTAGAPPPPAVILPTQELGFLVSHGYGLTETAGLAVTCSWKPARNRLPLSDQAQLKARQGVRSLGMTEVDVVEPVTLKSVQRDGTTQGEIVVKGASVMLGYLKDPKATAMCMKDGWFFTGDVGVIHPDGYLEIKDRSKDIIISGGENISSVEVESVLYMHPAIDEAAVVARPDEKWGETPCSFVNLKPEYEGKVGEEDIMGFCRQKLPHYMVPKTVVFGELPKTATGKIQKVVLRKKAKELGSPTCSSIACKL